jgi:hypothetical protein
MDCTASNWFFDQQTKEIILLDFGSASVLDKSGHVKIQEGEESFWNKNQAPEMRKPKDFSFNGDVFALGKIWLEKFFYSKNDIKFHGKDLVEFFDWILEVNP